MKLSSALAFLSLLATPALGLAASPGEASNSVAVWMKDLDLNNPHDAKVLLQRVNDAAFEACGGAVWSDPMERQVVETSKCYEDSVGQAVANINSPALTATYGAHRMQTASR